MDIIDWLTYNISQLFAIKNEATDHCSDKISVGNKEMSCLNMRDYSISTANLRAICGRHIDPEKIVWESDDCGSYLAQPKGKRFFMGEHGLPIYSRRMWIESQIWIYIKKMVNDPGYWNDGKYEKPFHIDRDVIGLPYPLFTRWEHLAIQDIVNSELQTKVWNFGESIDLSDDTNSNFLYLLGLGVRRNWRNECSICLKDNVGSQQKHGYCEVVIFRSCGHSFCLNPCFQDIIAVGKEVDYMEGVSDIMNFGNDKIICPLCRRICNYIFRTECVELGFMDFPDNFLDSIFYKLKAKNLIKQ